MQFGYGRMRQNSESFVVKHCPPPHGDALAGLDAGTSTRANYGNEDVSPKTETPGEKPSAPA
jgi:hypothetical protein